MEQEWLLTSVLEFENRFEGQVFHRGSEEECKRIAGLIDAISYSGDEQILNSGLKWFPASTLDIPTGHSWKLMK